MQAGVGQQQQQRLVAADGCGQFGHLLVGQVDRTPAVLAGQLDVGGRVGRQQMIANGVGQDRRQHVVGAAHHARPHGCSAVHTVAQVRHPPLDRRRPDVAESDVAPARSDPHPPLDLHHPVAGGFEVPTLAVQPRRPQLGDRHPRMRRCDVLAAHLGDLHHGGEPLGVPAWW